MKCYCIYDTLAKKFDPQLSVMENDDVAIRNYKELFKKVPESVVGDLKAACVADFNSYDEDLPLKVAEVYFLDIDMEMTHDEQKDMEVFK